LVPGGVSRIPGDQTLGFDPDRDLAYGARVFLNVAHCQGPQKKQCRTLHRATFRTRELPTLLSGIVQDQFGNPVAGVRVRLAGSGKTKRTGDNGSFAFGYGKASGSDVEPGDRRLVLNPDWQDREFGVRRVALRVRAGKANEIGPVQLSRLRPDRGFHQVGGGRHLQALAGGRLDLDLRQATVRFPGGEGQGPMHVQILPRTQVPYPSAMKAASPAHLFAFQPAGVEVEGKPHIRMRLPRASSDESGGLPDGLPVTLVGLDPAVGKLVPIGVGEVAGEWVVSKRVESPVALDYLGYAFAPKAAQKLLARFRDGEMSLAALRGQLAGIGK
jgi:hypothetical protein